VETTGTTGTTSGIIDLDPNDPFGFRWSGGSNWQYRPDKQYAIMHYTVRMSETVSMNWVCVHCMRCDTYKAYKWDYWVNAHRFKWAPHCQYRQERMQWSRPWR
jgi:hypothetical protein